VGPHVTHYHGAGTDHGAVPDVYSREDHGSMTDPDIVADGHVTLGRWHSICQSVGKFPAQSKWEAGDRMRVVVAAYQNLDLRTDRAEGANGAMSRVAEN